ncbi:hypothetical protein [Devosia elaeis]|uniref:ParB/Sulfiredoxin domain-containing protein n=1 Tax=Devosia elaeis TaxID=1770058 RepID=A0A178HPA1_9HYPH|nr:hypothetical protein [Devosia elaeis]OAM74429.1 hypothetical protein A3840_15885 [Devosia elaeis]
MSYRHLPLAQLLINSANDRHGELENETAAIAQLFAAQEQHMRNLAKDLVVTEEVFEPPLVFPSGEAFVVADGNRRTTCLKLLSNPRRAPTVELQEFFGGLREQWRGSFPESIECRVETDRDRIDEILYRRHTGVQGGIGHPSPRQIQALTSAGMALSHTRRRLRFELAGSPAAASSDLGRTPVRPEIGHAPNAISVLFRVLLELSIANYVSRTGLSSVHENDKLSNKAGKVAADLETNGKIDAKYRGVVGKLQQSEGIISIDTLNRYVHSPNFSVSPEHLKMLWNTLADFIVLCLEA